MPDKKAKKEKNKKKKEFEFVICPRKQTKYSLTRSEMPNNTICYSIILSLKCRLWCSSDGKRFYSV